MRKNCLPKWTIFFLLPLFFLSGCSVDPSQITIVGSSALQPLAEQAANDYHDLHAESNIVVQGGGSGTGLSQVQAGAVQIGSSDVFADTQKGINACKLQDYRVAVVGIVPIANKDAHVKNLSSKQLKDIFIGKITNWQQVGGKNLKIIVINRSRGSGTRTTFESLILDGQEPLKTQEQDSNGTVKKIVSTTPGTISYLSFPYANGQDIQKLCLDGIKPINKNIADNRWPLWSYEHMYTKGQPNKRTKAFLKYMLSSQVQKKLISKIGYFSINKMRVRRDSHDRITKLQK